MLRMNTRHSNLLSDHPIVIRSSKKQPLPGARTIDKSSRFSLNLATWEEPVLPFKPKVYGEVGKKSEVQTQPNSPACSKRYSRNPLRISQVSFSMRKTIAEPKVQKYASAVANNRCQYGSSNRFSMFKTLDGVAFNKAKRLSSQYDESSQKSGSLGDDEDHEIILISNKTFKKSFHRRKVNRITVADIKLPQPQQSRTTVLSKNQRGSIISMKSRKPLEPTPVEADSVYLSKISELQLKLRKLNSQTGPVPEPRTVAPSPTSSYDMATRATATSYWPISNEASQCQKSSFKRKLAPSLSPEMPLKAPLRSSQMKLPELAHKPARLEARDTMVALNREVSKLERLHSNQKKARMRLQFNQEFGIQVSDQKAFFTKASDLEIMMIRRAGAIRMERAAIKIQRWFRHVKVRSQIRAQLEGLVKKIKTAKRVTRKWSLKVRHLKQEQAKKAKAAVLAQRFIRGYLCRQQCLLQLSAVRTQALHDYFSGLELKMKTQLQLMIRRAWLNYKQRKAAKLQEQKKLAKLSLPKGTPNTLEKSGSKSRLSRARTRRNATKFIPMKTVPVKHSPFGTKSTLVRVESSSEEEQVESHATHSQQEAK